MRKKILLIQPKHTSNVRLFGKSYMSQLTLPVLASLTPPRFEVEIVDDNVEEIDFDSKPDIVGITILTPTAERGYQISKEFRSRGVPVVLGGVHATLLPDEAKEHCDVLVIGEAENTWPALLEDFEKGAMKEFYRSERKPSLDCLPEPRRDLVNNHLYVRIPKVEVSRGCPHNCSFCSTTRFFGNRMRYRKIQDVVDEVKRLRTKFVFFTDNNIIGNPQYAKRLFKALRGARVKWVGQASLKLAEDIELLKLARKSGCVGILVGFESLSVESIEKMGKKAVNKVKEYKRAIKRIHRHGIGLIGCFVFGFDEDDETVFSSTVKLVKKLNIEVPQFTLLTPFPGTAIRDKFEEAQRILHNQWDLYDVVHVVFQPLNMSVDELRRNFDEACGSVYSRWATIKRLLRSFVYLRSLYRVLVFAQINAVYRKLWMVGFTTKTPVEIGK